jgi:hypothetical protein
MADENDAAHEPIKIPSMKKLGDLKVTIPLGFVAVIATLAWRADDITVGYLDDFFVTKASAQEITEKIGALEGKVENLSGKIDQHRVKQLERELFDLRIQHCMSEGALKTLLQTQITALVVEWRGLTRTLGDPPTLVRCEDLG